MLRFAVANAIERIDNEPDQEPRVAGLSLLTIHERSATLLRGAERNAIARIHRRSAAQVQRVDHGAQVH